MLDDSFLAVASSGFGDLICMSKNLNRVKNLFLCAFLVLAADGIFAQAEGQNDFNEAAFVQKLGGELENGSVENALALFDSLPPEKASDIDLLSLKASILVSAGKGDEAEKLAADLLSREPENIDVLTLNMMIAKERGNSAKKSQYVKQIIALQPYNAAANIELASEQALKRNYRNARDYYSKALVSEPENEDALFGYGKMSYYMEKDDDAKKSFNKILEKNPENAEALSYLGKFAAESRQYAKAIEYVNKALETDPDNAEHYFDLGNYSRYMGKYDDAEKYWKTAIEKDPDYFLGYVYLAGLYDEEDKRDEAYLYYKKVLEKNPRYYYAYESLGMFAWDKGNWAEARENFLLAREANPDNISYALMVVASYDKEKKFQEAKKYAATVMKGLDRNSLDYLMVRLFSDLVGESSATQKVNDEKSAAKKGKFTYYLGLYWEIKGNDSLAKKYYSEVASMQGAMFFEARLAQWKTLN